MQYFKDLVLKNTAPGPGSVQTKKEDPPASVSLNSDAQQGRTYLDKVSGPSPGLQSTSGLSAINRPQQSEDDRLREAALSAWKKNQASDQTTKGAGLGTRGSIDQLGMGNTGPSGPIGANLTTRASLPTSAEGLTSAGAGSGQHLADPDPATQSPDPADLFAGWNVDAQRNQYWRDDTLGELSKWQNMDPQEYAKQIYEQEAAILDETYNRMMGGQMRDMQSGMGARGMGMGGAASAMAGDISARAAAERAQAGIGIREGARGEALGMKQQALNQFGQEANNMFGGQFDYGRLALDKAAEDRKADAYDRFLKLFEDPETGGGDNGVEKPNPDNQKTNPAMDVITGGGGVTAGGDWSKDDFLGFGDEDVAMNRVGDRYGNQLNQRQKEAAQSPKTSGPVPATAKKLGPDDPGWPGGYDPKTTNVFYDEMTNTYYAIPASQDTSKEGEQLKPSNNIFTEIFGWIPGVG